MLTFYWTSSPRCLRTSQCSCGGHPNRNAPACNTLPILRPTSKTGLRSGPWPPGHSRSPGLPESPWRSLEALDLFTQVPQPPLFPSLSLYPWLTLCFYKILEIACGGECGILKVCVQASGQPYCPGIFGTSPLLPGSVLPLLATDSSHSLSLKQGKAWTHQ